MTDVFFTGNSVRLPVGYFTLGPAYCHDTPFASVAEVYANAWSAVKKIIARCHSRGIGTLVDLHALPGGANGGDHSGTNSGKAQLWENRSNLDLATRCLLFIVKESKGVAGIVGVQLCNEAEANAKGMYEWYDEVAREVASIDHTVPLYISDGWDLGQAITYCNGKNSLSAGLANPVVIDTHLYWAFSDADKQKTPHQIIDEVPRKLTELDKHDGSVHDHGAAQVVVGEYSCVLSEPTWTKMGNDHKEALVQAFGQAQTRRYQQRAGGSFFWTYRMVCCFLLAPLMALTKDQDWMDGGEWGFKQQCKTNAITAPACFSHSHDDIKTRIKSAREHEKDKMQQTFTTHCHYWDSHYPGQYEHHRFEQGWKLGFDDAEAFYGMRAEGHIAGAGGDKIGLLDIWVKKRLVESGQSGKFVWEFEQGMRQGVRDFYAVVGC